MGRSEQLVFGLDIGTRTVVGTVGYKKNEGDFTVVAQKVKEHDTRAMLDGQIHDIGKVAETIKDVKRALEKQLDGRKLDEVCIAAAGRVLKTVTVHVEDEFTESRTVDEESVRSLELLGVEKAYAEIKKSLSGDDTNYYCVAYSVVRYYLNGFQMASLVDHKADKIGADILATFLPDEVIEGLYTTVDKAGLKVQNLTLEPIAAMIVAVPEKFRLLNIALVDVGAGTSDICITRDGSIMAYGMIPMAGDCLTEVIATNHLVDFNTADAIKVDAGSRKRSIKYKDIMGLEKSCTPASVRQELSPKINEMAERAAEEIKKLNGGKAVSAVFVVGGGGKIPGYTDALATKLGIPKERVALRGEEVLSFVHFPDDSFKKTPELVTPIGICLNYYEKRNNFIFVNLNGESVKLYDNNRLTVADAAMAIGYPNDRLFPRRGKALEFKVNGQARLIRGNLGEAAVITINSHEASASSQIAPNDDIIIKDSTVGTDASLEVMKLPEYNKGEISFFVDGKNIVCPKFIEANGKLVSGFYDIKQDDDLVLLNYYTLSQLLEFMDLPFTDDIYVNNEKAGKDTKVYENFKVETGKKEKSTSEIIENAIREQAEEGSDDFEDVETDDLSEGEEDEEKIVHVPRDINISVNGTNHTLKGKGQYVFVDVLDVYPFDIKNPKGSDVEMTINGRKAQFTDTIKDGDALVLRWI